MTDIFISYSRKDLVVAANLAAALDNLGYVVWWDRRNLRGGQAFAREIERVIKRAACVIVIWSQHSAKSEWVYAEASLAYQQGNLLTAVYDEAEIPLPFNTRHNEDLSHWRGDLRHSGLQKLLQSVGRSCSQAAYQKHVEQQQNLDTVLSPASGLAWSSVLSISLATASLAVAGSVFYLQTETPFLSDLLTVPEEEPHTSVAEQAVSVVVPQTPEAPAEPQPVAKQTGAAGASEIEQYQLIVNVKPAHVFARASVTVNGELWLQNGSYPPGNSYKVVVSAEGYQTYETYVAIVNHSVPVDVVMVPEPPETVEPVFVPPVKSSQQIKPGQVIKAVFIESKVASESLPIEPDMVDIPAGSFVPDCPAKGTGKACDSSASVNVAAFRMAKTEVTVEQFTRFAEENTYKTTAEQQGWCWGGHNSKGEWGRFPQGTWRQTSFPQSKEHPVACVSGVDVNTFIRWLNKKTGKRYALPTERQWEYAARGGLKQRSMRVADRCKYGNIIDQAAVEAYPAWKSASTNCRDGYVYSAPVQSFAANGYDLHDMQGNVWEWTRPDDGGGELQIIRGASWGFDSKIVSPAAPDRVVWEHNYPSEHIGFRLVELIN